MVTPRELNIVYGESNEINGEKIVLSFTAEKHCLLFIRSEKNCTFKAGSRKKFDHEVKTIAPPPRIKWSAPKTCHISAISKDRNFWFGPKNSIKVWAEHFTIFRVIKCISGHIPRHKLFLIGKLFLINM